MATSSITAGNLDTMQAFFLLQYSYDGVGNITGIADEANPTLTQSFTYDILDRLTAASATGNGNYSESYTYDQYGRLANKGSATYYYDPNHYHAVSSLSNGNTYGYDANGNMTTRSVGGVSHVLEYDADNHMTRQTNSQNGYRYIYDGNGQLVVKMYEASGARSIYLGSYAEVTYNGAAAATPTPSATLSPTVTRTPVPSRTSTLTPTKSRTPTRTATATKTNTPSRTRTPTKTATRITQTKTNTKTVVVQTVYSVTPILSKTATPTRTSTITPTATKTATRTSTSTRKAFGWPTNTPTFTPTTTITHSPVPTNTATPIPNLAGMAWKFYYLAGSERVAMRVIDGGSNQLYYLFTDHLGSTSEVRRADGSLHSRQYYRAFGEERYTTGALPTDRTYTGQREIENGLVHYGARIYDPGLAQFLQADSINPDRYDPESWNKYSYVQYKPINSIDPTGHKEVECDSEGNCLDIRDLLAQYHRADDWQRAQLSFDEFVIGYGCYQYFMAHPEEALQNAMDDTDAYYYADTYSEYVLHAMFQPFDEGPVMVMAEQARISGDANTFWSAMLWLAVGYVFEAADKGFGGGSPQFTRLSKGEIKALKKAGIDIHLLKGTGKVSQYDLFKDGNGEIYIKPRSGIGPGEPLGINIKKILGK